MDTKIISSVGQAQIKYKCPVSGFQKIAGGKHKLRILWALRKGPAHYGDLKRASAMFSEFTMDARVFTRELSLLRESGLIDKKLVSGNVRKTEYSLTPLGESMVPVLETICNWSLTNLDIIVPEGNACIDP